MIAQTGNKRKKKKQKTPCTPGEFEEKEDLSISLVKGRRRQDGGNLRQQAT
jgi:hypothetical protein